MPKGFEKIITAQKQFNEKYGVSFDIEEFAQSIDGLDEFGGGSSADELYKVEFAKLYKKAHANFIDKRLAQIIDFGEMINEFEDNIIAPYYQKRKSEGQTAPTPYGGWSVREYLSSVERHLSTVPENKHDFATKRYAALDIRIRDMRAFADELINNNDASPEKLATLYCYHSALSRVNEGRSFLKAVFVNPIRHLAEKRCMDKIKTYIEEKTGGPMSLENAAFKNVYDISNNDDIERSKNTVSVAIHGAIQERSKDANVANKENMVVDDAMIMDEHVQKNEKVTYKENLSKKEFISK